MANFFSRLLGLQPPENVLSEEAKRRLSIPETPAVQRIGTEVVGQVVQPTPQRGIFSDLASVAREVFNKETIEEAQKQQDQLPVFKQMATVRNFLGSFAPRSEEEAGKMGLIKIGGTEESPTYLDITGATGALKTVQDIIGEEFLSLVRKTKLAKTAEEFVVGIAKDTRNKIAQALEIPNPIEATKEFYNRVRGGIIKEREVKPEVKLFKEGLEPAISRSIADEAIKFAKENPESSLVAKEFRDPRTKELIAGPRLFKRIGEALENGEIRIDDLPEIVKHYGLDAKETARLFEDAATYSGRTLQALSRVEKELRALLPDIEIAKREPTLWEKFKSGYLAVDNFRRGVLVTQMATAARNAISQAVRYGIGTITDGMSGVISKITGKGAGFTPFFEDIAAVLRKAKPGNLEKVQSILRKFPLENARLYNTPVSDVALSGKITNFFNTLNRGQEYFFRNLILDAKLHTAAKVKGVPIEKLGVDEIAGAVGDALEWTFAKGPERGSFGDAIMRMYRAMPPLTLVNPFPRFMSSAVKFLYDYSPLGIMSLFKSSTRAAIAAGDYTAISKAIIGTSMLGGALTIRANQNLAGEKWYEIKFGNKVIDTRPFPPFSTYLFLAEVMLNGGKNISPSDWAQAAIGINRIAGTGLALVDLINRNVDYKNVKSVVGNIVSTYVGGFTVPFVTIKDIIGNFKLEERTVKETREIPIIGAAIGNIPGLQELLPTKYSMFQDKPLEREMPLLRQLTGLTVTTKPYIQKELDRMGKDIGDLIPKTGNLEANRIISKQTGVILNRFNEVLEMSEKYQTMDSADKLEFLKSLISEATKEAKGEVASDLAGVVYNELKKVSKEKRPEVVKELYGRGLLTENILDYLLPMLEAQPLP